MKSRLYPTSKSQNRFRRCNKIASLAQEACDIIHSADPSTTKEAIVSYPNDNLSPEQRAKIDENFLAIRYLIAAEAKSNLRSLKDLIKHNIAADGNSLQTSQKLRCLLALKILKHELTNIEALRLAPVFIDTQQTDATAVNLKCILETFDGDEPFAADDKEEQQEVSKNASIN